MFQSTPNKHIQPVRIRYGAESLQGDRDRLFSLHEGFVLPFLRKLGFIVTEEKLSRLDLQCLVDIPVRDFMVLLLNGHFVTKFRKKAIYGTMTRDETFELGSMVNIQLCIYDKRQEFTSRKSSVLKEAQFMEECVGEEWYNSSRPITRVEFRLGRDALKSFGIDTISDLRDKERGLIDILTTEWVRILEKPKIRGHENTASIHPIWERVRRAFFSHFTGKVSEVKWEKRASVSCDPVALERQALGCMSKALAYRFGEQVEVKDTKGLANGWVDTIVIDLHEKLNVVAEVVRHKTGIELGPRVSGKVVYDESFDIKTTIDSELADRKRREYFDSILSQGGG